MPVAKRRSETGRHAARLAILLGLLASPSIASAGCVFSDLLRDGAKTARVRAGAPRLHFVWDNVLVAGCPDDRPACRERAFVVPGDVVLAGPVHRGYTCAAFASVKAVTIGWLPTAALLPIAAVPRASTDWTGRWTAPEQEIAIDAGPGGALRVRGSATWGMGDPWRVRNGGVHIGEIAARARPTDGVLAFAMGDDGRTLPYAAGDEFTCRLRLVRRGSYLIAKDNNMCGGANVSFSGIYVRAR